MSRAKHWCFTLNNYSCEQPDILANLFARDEADIAYICWGREVGAEGTPHLQGFVSFRSKRALKYVRVFIPRAHLEIARGTPSEAIAYCEKDGVFTEFGARPAGRGQRSDLDAVKSAIDGGATMEELAETYFGSFLRYHRGFALYFGLRQQPRCFTPDVFVFYGATGTGKTRKAYEQDTAFDAQIAIYSHPGGMWFDGFNGQHRAIFDDYGGSEFAITYLLKLLDRYPMKVPVKGSFVEWNCQQIYITSNRHPDLWYPNALPEHVKAMKRRFTEVREFIFPLCSKVAKPQEIDTITKIE